MNKKLVLGVIAVALVGFGIRCFRKAEPGQMERSMTLMGRPARVMVPVSDQHHLGPASSFLRTMAGRIAPIVDREDPNSEISLINRIAYHARFPLSRDMSRMLEIAQRMNESTQGAYDITVVALTPLRGLQDETAPEHDLDAVMQSAARAGVGADKISLRPESIRFNSPHTQIGVEDLAQGYVVDMSIVHMRRQGATHLLIQLGDHVRVLGRGPNDAPWVVDVPHPDRDGERIGVLRLSEYAAASTVRSGRMEPSYPEYSVHPVIDPRTGRVARDMAAVTVVGPTATDSYALAMALLVAGTEEGREILAEHAPYSALFIPDKKPLEIWLSEEMRNVFVPDPDYADTVRWIGGE